MTAVLPGMMAHCSGALWLEEARTLLVADLHLGYSWAQRRRGELGPLADFEARDKLLRVCDELQPARVVFVGDLVHAPRPCQPERAYIEQTLGALADKAEIVAVRGNHDRAFAKEFGHLRLQAVQAWTDGVITAIHGDKLAQVAIPERGTLVMGHLHPGLSVREASGAGRRLPTYLVNRWCVVMPAFSPFARGYDVAVGLTSELEACFRGEPVEAYVVTPKRVVGVGRLEAAVAKVGELDESAPSRFRRWR